MMNEASEVGFFGKSPHHADFQQRGLPSSFVKPWDQWISEGLFTSRSYLSQGWTEAYLLSPPWRFLLSPQVMGDHGWAGIMVSSMDRVNRFFPMTLAIPLNHSADFESLADFHGVYDQLQIAAFAIVDAFYPIEQILGEARQAIFVEIEKSKKPHPSYQWCEAGEQARAWVTQNQRQRRLAPQLPTGLNLNYLRDHAYSLWWHDGWEPHAPTSLVTRGLPAHQNFAAMLDGDWQKHHWITSDAAQGKGIELNKKRTY